MDICNFTTIVLMSHYCNKFKLEKSGKNRWSCATTDNSSGEVGEGSVPGQLWVHSVVQEILRRQLRPPRLWPGVSAQRGATRGRRCTVIWYCQESAAADGESTASGQAGRCTSATGCEDIRPYVVDWLWHLNWSLIFCVSYFTHIKCRSF